MHVILKADYEELFIDYRYAMYYSTIVMVNYMVHFPFKFRIKVKVNLMKLNL